MLSSGLEDLFLERELLSNIFLESQCCFFLDLKGSVAKSGRPWIGGSFGTAFGVADAVLGVRLWTRQKWTLRL